MCILTASPSYLGFPLYQVARQQGIDSIWLGSPPAASRPAGLGAEGWQSLRQNGVCQTSREGTPFLAHLSISGQPGRGSAGRSVRNSSSAWPQVMALRRALLSAVSIPCPVWVAGVPGCMSSPGKGGNCCNLLQPRAPTASSPTWTYLPWPLALSWVPADAFNIRPESGPHPSSGSYVSLHQARFLLLLPALPCPLEPCLLLAERDEQRGPASQHQTGAFSVPQQKMRFLVEQT